MMSVTILPCDVYPISMRRLLTISHRRWFQPVKGLGRRMVAAALALVPATEPVFAQASPGNAASLRALLASGFRPISSEVLFVTHRR
jgi:hypothetical protein